MLFIKLFTLLKAQLFNWFVFLYSNIYIYTEHKKNTFEDWKYHIGVSYIISFKSTIFLCIQILYLYITGLFIKLYYILITKAADSWRGFFQFLELFYSMFGRSFWIRSRSMLIFHPVIHLSFYHFKFKELKKAYSNLIQNKKIFFSILYLYIFIKTFLLSLLITFLFAIVFIYMFSISFLRQLAVWFVLFFLFFWLISGFNFFIKRSRYGRFTSAIQRFWKRANMCFWLVEGFLFLIFYFYYWNSSQEPIFMADYSSLNQEHLLSLTSAYKSLVLLSFILFLLSIYLVFISFLGFSQLICFFLIIFFTLLNIFYIESYQFYYLLNSFLEGSWVYSDETNSFSFNFESQKLRTKHWYFFMCLIAKYWHFMFIFLGWIFFFAKLLELKRVRFTLYAYNYQNLLILYALNLLTYLQWIKYIFHKFIESSYFWFFSNPDISIFYLMRLELLNLVYAFFNIDFSFLRLLTFTLFSTKYFFIQDSSSFLSIFLS